MYEGVFVEFVFVVLIGGVICDIKVGKIVEGFVIVCMVIGNGLKDFDIVIK